MKGVEIGYLSTFLLLNCQSQRVKSVRTVVFRRTNFINYKRDGLRLELECRLALKKYITFYLLNVVAHMDCLPGPLWPSNGQLFLKSFLHKLLGRFLKEGKLVEISGGMFVAADVLTASAAITKANGTRGLAVTSA